MFRYEHVPQTVLPNMRELPTNPFDAENAVIIQDEELASLKEAVPIEVLSQAVDKAESEHAEEKLRRGVQPTGCGGDHGGEDSVYSHTVEHAVIAVMDYLAPEDEAGIGITFPHGFAEVQPEDRLKIAHKYKIQIAPPPSITLTGGRRISQRTIELMEEQFKGTGEVNLKRIAEQISKEAK